MKIPGFPALETFYLVYIFYAKSKNKMKEGVINRKKNVKSVFDKLPFVNLLRFCSLSYLTFISSLPAILNILAERYLPFKRSRCYLMLKPNQ